MKHIQSILFVVIFSMITLSITAQKSIEFPKKINFIKMTDAGIAIVGTDDALYGVDKDGNQVWANEKLRKVEPERVEILTGSELIFVSDKGLLARNRVLNVLDGREYANTGIKYQNIFAARIIHGANQLWVMHDPSGSTMNVWDIDQNKELYAFNFNAPYNASLNNMASMTATFSGCQPITYTSESSAIIHLGLGQLGNYNLTTGAPIWTFDWKPYKIKKPGNGKGDKPTKPSSGYSIMKIDDTDGTLYFPFMEQLIAVDSKTGQPKWGPKDGDTGFVKDMYVLDDGILVLTYKGLQLINKNSGEPIWDKHMKIKGASESLLLKDGNDFYAVSKKSVIAIDVKNKSSKVLTEKIKFQGGESFSSLKSFDDVLVLKSSHNSVAIDKQSGDIIHATYFKPPGGGIAALAYNLAMASVAMANTMHSYQLNRNTAISNNQRSFRYHQYTPRMRKSKGSTQTVSDHIAYVSTKFKGGDAEGFGVARVNTRTGDVTDKIVIGSREPIYAVDEDNKVIFFKSGKNVVEIKAIK